MEIPKSVKVNGEDYEIFVSGTKVITIPQSITLQDSIEEMLEDIGAWDIVYLQEVYNDNATFSIQ